MSLSAIDAYDRIVAAMVASVFLVAHMALLAYLRSVRSALTNIATSTARVHVVLGNEACDLDSAVCAIVTGYMLKGTTDELIVPMLNIPRADYPLKTEVRFVFSQANITDSMLTFHDDLDLPALHRSNRLEVTLVDHNVLAEYLQPIHSAIVRVIDHHKLEASFTPAVEKTIEVVGSCATLVGEKLLTEKPDRLDQLVANLILSTIVADTVNFSESAKKTTPKDVKIFDNLKALFPSDTDWTSQYTRIAHAKGSVASMAVRDLLRKDLKMVIAGTMRIAMPTVPISMSQLLEMPNFEADLEHFRKQQQANAVVVMTACTTANSDTLQRGMAVHAESDDLRKSLVDYLTKFAEPSLDLREMTHTISASCVKHPSTHVMVQGNSAASRKIVLPAVRAFAESYTKAVPV